MVRALASHQCGPGSILGLGVVCGLSLLLVFVLAPRGFSPGTSFLPSPQTPTFLNSNSIWRETPISALRWIHWHLNKVIYFIYFNLLFHPLDVWNEGVTKPFVEEFLVEDCFLWHSHDNHKFSLMLIIYLYIFQTSGRSSKGDERKAKERTGKTETSWSQRVGSPNFVCKIVYS